MPQVYRYDRNKLKFSQIYRRHGKLHLALLWAVARWLNVLPAASSAALTRPEGVKRLDPKEAPEDARRALGPALAEAAAAGLRVIFHYAVLPEGALGAQELQGSVLAGDDLRFWAVIGWVRFRRGTQVHTRTALKCRSRLDDGRILLTSSARPVFDAPPEVWQLSIRDASPSKIIEAHLKRLAGIPIAKIVPVREDRLEYWLLRQMQETFDHLVSTGCLVPVSA